MTTWSLASGPPRRKPSPFGNHHHRHHDQTICPPPCNLWPHPLCVSGMLAETRQPLPPQETKTLTWSSCGASWTRPSTWTRSETSSDHVTCSTWNQPSPVSPPFTLTTHSQPSVRLSTPHSRRSIQKIIDQNITAGGGASDSNLNFILLVCDGQKHSRNHQRRNELPFFSLSCLCPSDLTLTSPWRRGKLKSDRFSMDFWTDVQLLAL